MLRLFGGHCRQAPALIFKACICCLFTFFDVQGQSVSKNANMFIIQMKQTFLVATEFPHYDFRCFSAQEKND